MNKKTLLWIALAVILVGGTAAAYFSFAGSAPEEQDTQILTQETKSGTVSVQIEGPSLVEAVQTRDLRSRVGGIVTLAPEVGDLVSADQVILAFQTDDLQAAVTGARLGLDQARLDLNRANQTVTAARADLEEQQTLLNQGSVARSKVDAASAALDTAVFNRDTAQIKLSQAQLALDRATADLQDAQLKAPFDGVIVAAPVKVGDLAGSSALLATVADLSRVRLRAEVDEFDIGSVAVGMPVVVTSDALPDETMRSKVEAISPEAQIVNNISIFTVSTVLPNDENKLRPGMSADMSILVSADKGVLVPSKAISTVRGRSYLDVWQDGEVQTLRVVIGADDGVNTAVVEGLEEGALVVLPETASFSLTGTTSSSGSSIVPITVPGTGGR